MKAIIFLALACLMSACSSIPGKMNKLYPGMPETEAVALLGQPDTVSSAGGNGKVAYYQKRIVGFGDERDFFVRYGDAAVEQWGQVPFQPISPAAAMAIMQYRPIQPYQAPVYQMPVSRPVNCTSNSLGSTTYTNCN